MKKFILGAVALIALVAPAVAADLSPRIYSKAPASLDPAYNWTGFYVGVNAGGAWGRSDASTIPAYSPPGYFATTSPGAIAIAGAQRLNSSGFTGGLTAGYNWQAGNVVFGVESDFNYLGLKVSSSGSGIYPCCVTTGFTVNSSVSTDWLMTFRPRVGIAANNWLFYVTGGLALANVKSNFSFTDTFATATESAAISKTKAGWTVGAGTEYALMNGWSIKAEYLYVDLGRESTTSTNLAAFTPSFPFPSNPFTHSVDMRTNIVRAGLNYKFGGPVVAKY
jgi:outer membrane immunogenic protein